MEHLLTTGLKDFMLAGKATFTLVSTKTGVRYTYRVRKAKDRELWFVSYLRGANNETDYSYLGIIIAGNFKLTAKSVLPATSQPVVAISWFVARLLTGKGTEGIEFYHAGHCGRCGRLLTVPESIESGFGPECIQLMGGLPHVAVANCSYCGEGLPHCRCYWKNEIQKREIQQEQLAFERKLEMR